MAAPFLLHYPSLTDNLKGEGVPFLEVTACEDNLPQATERVLHGNAALSNPEMNGFSPGGMILKLDVNGHNACY